MKKFLTSIIVLVWFEAVLGQTHVGSAYNVYGLGTLESPSLAAFSGMGHTGIGVRSPYNINMENPASLNALIGPSHQFDVELQNSFLIQQDQDESSISVLTGLQNLNLWYRFLPKGAFIAGVKPFSKANYDVTSSTNISSVFGPYNVRYQGTGGISQVYLGSGYQVFKGLNLGVRANFLFGSLNEIQILSGNDIVGETVIDQSEYMTKFFFDFGGQYSMRLSGHSSLTLGITYRPEYHFDSRIEHTIVSRSLDSLQTESEGQQAISSSLGYGLSFAYKRWVFAGDFNNDRWSRLPSGEDYTFQDQYTFSFGMELNPDLSSENYFNRIDLRTGFSLGNYYLTVDGQDFNTFTFNFGLGLPVRYGSGTINLGYEYRDMGTTENLLIKETTHKITLGVSIRESWFREHRYD